MSALIDGIKLSMSYFTILPIKLKEDRDYTSKTTIRTLLVTLPLIGILIASLSIFIFYLFLQTPFKLYGALMGALFYTLLSGFLHLEGFIDTVDGIYAKHSGKEPYLIMKEPHIGAMGMLYGVSLFIAKTAAIVTIFLYTNPLLLFLVAPISRLFILLYLRIASFHENSTFLLMMRRHCTNTTIVIAALLPLLSGYFLLELYLIPFIISQILIALFIFYSLQKSFGYTNGDIVGANIELHEFATLNLLLLLFLTLN